MLRNDFSFTLREAGGALADLGVLVPLVLLLIMKNGMNPTAVLAWAGIVYIISGALFRVPMPVQPLKAVSIIAIAANLSPSVIAAAGILMGGILLCLSVTGASDLLSRIFTRPIVRGIQLGVGIMLVSNGMKMLLDPRFLQGGGKVIYNILGADVPAGLLAGIIGTGILMIFAAGSRVPSVILLLLFGVAASLAFGSYETLQKVTIAPAPLHPALPSLNDFTTAFFMLVLPQLPLTFGNSIVATADTAAGYFGGNGRRVTPRRLALMLGFTNITAGLIGAAPLCHGAGGMTAHYRFGARTGAMGIMIGTLLLAVGLLFGQSAPQLFVLVPPAILGVLLIFIGIEHAMLIRDILDARGELFVTIAIGTIAAATGNILAGTAAGFCLLAGERLFRLKQAECR